MPRFEFEIGEAFPAKDPVARFVAVLAMIHNDWLRTMRAMEPAPEDDARGVRLLFARQQFLYYHEATNFLLHFENNPSVAAWLSELDASAQEHYRNVMVERTHPDVHLSAWLARTRKDARGEQ
jgi:hypothetical protein